MAIPTQEKSVIVPVQDITLEGRLLLPGGPGEGKRGAVICHPHPRFGGSMDNAVVRSVAETLCAGGFRSLLFNFRGVGGSGGAYGDGIGEQDDVRGAVDFLEREGAGPICVVGYSFGAWVGLWASQDDERVRAAVGIAPPLTMFDFSFLPGSRNPTLLVAGSEDPLCPREALSALGGRPGTLSLEIVEGADHHFAGAEGILSGRVLDFLSTVS